MRKRTDDEVRARAARKERLAQLRKILGFTQEHVAERAGLSRVQINKIEGGSCKLTDHATRLVVAAAYGLDCERFDAVLAGDLTVVQVAKAAKSRVKSEARAAA